MFQFSLFKKNQSVDFTLSRMLAFGANFLFFDVPEEFQMTLQDPATGIMEALIDFHHDLVFFFVIIVTLVFWLLGRLLYLFDQDHVDFRVAVINAIYRKKLEYIAVLPMNFSKNLVAEIIWTIIPFMILLYIMPSSFSLLYAMDDMMIPSVTMKCHGHQWFWNYNMSDTRVFTSSAARDIDSLMFTQDENANFIFSLLDEDFANADDFNFLSSDEDFFIPDLDNNDIYDAYLEEDGENISELNAYDLIYTYINQEEAQASQLTFSDMVAAYGDHKEESSLNAYAYDLIYTYVNQEKARASQLTFSDMVSADGATQEEISQLTISDIVYAYINQEKAHTSQLTFSDMVAAYGDHKEESSQLNAYAYDLIYTYINQEEAQASQLTFSDMVAAFGDQEEAENNFVITNFNNDVVSDYLGEDKKNLTLEDAWLNSFAFEYPVVKKLQKLFFDSYMVGDSDLKPGQFRLLEVDKHICLPLQVFSRLLISAEDVIHSFAIPSLGVKMDAVPGRSNQVGVLIKRLGRFYGQCSEICGANHAFMPIVLECVSQVEFIKWYDSNSVYLPL